MSHENLAEQEKFKEGIIRLLSNYMLHNIKEEYKANPEKFQRTVDEEEMNEAERNHEYDLYDRQVIEKHEF